MTPNKQEKPTSRSSFLYANSNAVFSVNLHLWFSKSSIISDQKSWTKGQSIRVNKALVPLTQDTCGDTENMRK